MGKGGPMQPPQPMQAQTPAGNGAQQVNPAAMNNAANPALQKQMLGEKLYPLVHKLQPELAGKITGMMLEMDNSELLFLLQSEQQLKLKVTEALRVLQPQN